MPKFKCQIEVLCFENSGILQSSSPIIFMLALRMGMRVFFSLCTFYHSLFGASIFKIPRQRQPLPFGISHPRNDCAFAGAFDHRFKDVAFAFILG
jgi:hypothetical protein